MGLNWYIADAQALLHDYGGLFTPQAQLVRYVNEARRQIAYRTGCIRRHITGQSAFGASAQPGIFIPGAAQPGAVPGAFPAGTVANAAINSMQTIPGVERMPYRGFFNPYAQAQHAGIKGIFDVIEIAVNWGGSIRPALNWMPWDDLQAYARAYGFLTISYPEWWSCMSDGEDGEVWLFPPPSTTGEIELDAYCVPLDLNTDSDYDAIPEGYHSAVKFGAAATAFLSSQRYANAQMMGALFDERIGIGSQSRDSGKTQYYWGYP
jgi:hypothetical protein